MKIAFFDSVSALAVHDLLTSFTIDISILLSA